MQEQRVDPRLTTAEEHAEGVRQAQVLFKLNHTMPYTDEYNALVRELFGDNLGIDGYGWMDVASVSSEVYSWLAWVYVDGYDWINESNESVAVYPNPTTNNVNIAAPGLQHITVMNALGQVVYESKVDGNMTILDMSSYQAGVYMVRVTTENGESVKLVSKQ